jgi:eukaryotic-like serine/threonine-protein kinase
MDTKVADPMRGALLGGRYRITGRLARGGMATVYQARDERLDRIVAIKIIHPEHARDPRIMHRLAEEAKTVARLAHPNVVAVYDEGRHEDAPYLVMEFVRGRTLREVLNDRRRLDPAESLAMIEQVLAALSVAHRAGLVHRDVKPENILVAPPPNGSGDLVDAVVKVADFGLAHAVEPAGRASPTGQLMATAQYVAPELVAGDRADPRADVYSAGIVLFEMLTGRVPFDGERPADIAWRHVDHDVPPPSHVVPALPPLLDDVVGRATRRDPAGRPRDAGAMLSDVQAAREDVGALTGPTRAIAHPTVVVRPVDPRPSWARLPAGRGSISTARRRVAGLVPSGPLRGAWHSARGLAYRLRDSARGRRQLTIALVLVGLLLMTGGWWLGFGRYTEAPGLVNMTRTNAAAEAARLGFSVAIGTGLYAEEIPIDTVMKQDPPGGGRIVRGGTITLFLSLGPERYLVPDLAGQAADFAQSQLKQHFVVQTVNGYSDNLPVNYVVGTEPPAGTPLKPNATVKLIIAKGPYPLHVPSVVGKQVGEADGQLRALGFEVEVQRRDDESKPRDEVLEQNPPAGQGLASASGVKVVLVVANGPPGPPMPALVGARCSDAVNALRGMALQVNVNGNEFEWFFWTVKVQRPDPGQPVQPGQTVDLECG